MRRIVCVILLAGISIMSGDLKSEVRYHRYYDRDARDWHEWNENEGRAYRRYMDERRARYREYARLKRAEQRAYWKWRHTHPN
jgi:hypothetical protein